MTASTARPAGIVRWLLIQCRGLLAPLSLATLFGIVNAASGVVILVVACGAVLTGLAGGSPVPAIVTIVLVSLLKAGARYLEQYLGHRVAFSALARLRVLFFRALTPQAPALTASARSGELSGIATRDIDRVEVFFAHTLPPAVIAVVVPLGAVGWTATALSPLLALPLLLVWALVVCVVPWLGWRATGERTVALQAGTAGIAQTLTEQLQGVREIQAFNAAGARADQLDAQSREAGTHSTAIARRRARRKATVDAVQLAGHGAVVLVGAGAGLNGAAVLGALAVSIAVARPSRAVDGFASDLSASLAAARRLRTAMERPPAVQDAVPESPLVAVPAPAADGTGSSASPSGDAELVAISDVALSLGGRQILEPLSWSIPRGGHRAIVGVSGSGKSTLLSLLLRVHDPDQGSVSLSGQDLRTIPLASLRSRIALTTQRPEIFSGTLRDALRLRTPDASDEALHAALHLAVLDEWVAGLPSGLDTVIRQGGRTLSGGQRQRLALARSVVTPPELLILDESTGQLDAATETELRSRLAEWSASNGVTLLEVTHRVERVLGADRVLVLDDGRVAEEGDPAELAERDGALRRLLNRRVG
ncbi:MAG: ABC transporter ATP-binding protein [Mycetocola sp.]